MTNDDRFLDLLREDPPPAFKRGLQQKLAELDHEPTAAHRAFWRPALVAAAAALVVAGLAASPAVRAAAGEFLDVFRVRRFAAVPVDAERLSALQRGDLDLKALLADSVEVLEDPGSPEVVADAEAASAAAGFSLLMPTWLPNKTELADICVRGRASARLTIDAGRVQTLLDTLGVADARLPEGVDGAVVTVTTSPAVMVRYARGSSEILYTQAEAPVVSLPSGLDLASLGELALRAAGMEEDEARLFARKVDWRSTLLVPVPAVGGHFRDVEVRGQRGLVVTHKKDGGKGPRHSILLWVEGNRVFALTGKGEGVELLEMAESLS